MDCGPNCFSLLGYSDRETSTELAKRTTTGLHPETVIMLLDAGYGLDHKWQYIHAISQLKHYLPNQQATMASVGSEESGGHYFVILHNNGFWAIDPQSRSQYSLKDYLYMLRSYGRTLHIITSPHMLRKYNQVTMEEVNFFFPK